MVLNHAVRTVRDFSPYTSWCSIIWPLSLFTSRFEALLRTGPSSFSFKTRVKMIIATIIRLVTFPIWMFCWMVDEVLFSGYRKMNIDDTVWILSSPRTGCTNLAEALLTDDRDFVSPRLIEVIFPFICVNRVFDLIDYGLRRYDTSLDKLLSNAIYALNRVNMNTMNTNTMNMDAFEHHSMGLFQPTQLEILLSFWLSVSPPTQFTFPDPEYWRRVCLLDRLDDATYNRVHALRAACLKKVLFRRGNGRRLVFKAHTTEDAPNLYHYFPKATFIMAARRPSDQITPMLDYVNTFQTALSDTTAYTPQWVQARLEWLEHLWLCELEFCKHFLTIEERERKVVIVGYERFLNDMESVIFEMMEVCGVKKGREDAYVREKVCEFVSGQKGVMMSVKKKGEEGGESLETFGLCASDVNEKFSEYIEFFGL